MRRLVNLRARLQEEEGSLSAYLLVTVVLLVVIVGLVVDSAGKYQTNDRANQVAANAARAAVNSLSGESVRIGEIYLDAATAQTVAQSYISASGMSGTVTIQGQVVSVEVETTYTTKFLSLIGVNSLPADGAASAQLITNN